MFDHHVKILKVLEDAEEVIGRKKLQKIIYIAKKLEYPFSEKYNFHFYGPYSEELTLRIEELGNLGFLNEIREKKGRSFQYRYSLTEKGSGFLQQYQIELPPMREYVKKVNCQSSRFLELVSTILYFDDLSKAHVIEKIYAIKSEQNYAEEEIQEAYRYINDLKQLSEVLQHS
ncbi:YwgA family protein [Bacillus solimangrovi]|uniref:YwgA family protein n=1 Tax=Bacillus solimangrovi TaxID=1305675 RepID=A0A1E5LGP4_9BACI|nr:hypothetical protein [Bacillus solimangrovi]OEH93245.1 hypothetical protein BFG57_12645 [Bacillus solimangrovi]